MSGVIARAHCWTTRRRVARKMHRCDCGRRIYSGDVHLEHTAFPGLDVINVKAPVRLRECAPCAKRYGREHLLDDVPYDQCCRDGLL